LKDTIAVDGTVSDAGQTTMQAASRLTAESGKEAELLETAIASLK